MGLLINEEDIMLTYTYIEHGKFELREKPEPEIVNSREAVVNIPPSAEKTLSAKCFNIHCYSIPRLDRGDIKNKTLLPDFGLGVIQKASYRVVPFSKSKDTREIKRVIIEDQQVKN